jgi:predicted transcriptional regulator
MKEHHENVVVSQSSTLSLFGKILEKLGNLKAEGLVFALMLIMIHASVTVTLGLTMNSNAWPYVSILTCFEIAVMWLIPRINQKTRDQTSEQDSIEDCSGLVVEGLTFDLLLQEVAEPRILRFILNNQGCSTHQITLSAGVQKDITKKLLSSLSKEGLIHVRASLGKSRKYYINYGEFNEIVTRLRRLASIENLLGVGDQWF